MGFGGVLVVDLVEGGVVRRGEGGGGVLARVGGVGGVGLVVGVMGIEETHGFL